MKRLVIVTTAICALTPFAISAEEVSVTNSTNAETAVVADQTTGGSGTNVSPQGAVTAPPLQLREKPTLPQKGVLAPRDAASGLPTGKREQMPAPVKAVAPGLPADKREQMPAPLKKEVREHMQASTTGDIKRTMTVPHVLEKREAMTEKRASSTAAREERRNEAQQQLLERRMEIMKRFIAQQIHRMEVMIERLTKIADRIASRIQKLKERGVDTAKAEELLGIARTKLNEARTILSDAKAKAEEVASGMGSTMGTSDVDGDGALDIAAGENGTQGEKRDLGKPARDALQKAREAVRAAHRALIDAVNALKANATVPTDSGTGTSE